MHYEKHKPVKEEIISNLEVLKNDFWIHIDSYYVKYNYIKRIFSNHFFYQEALNNGVISMKATYSTEMVELVYSINGFMNDVYQGVNNAICLWFDSKGYKVGKNKNKYSEGIKKFYKNNVETFQNSTIERGILLEFRHGRNFFTHYGAVVTIPYIFNNSQIVYSAICNILNVLEEQVYFNEESYNSFLDKRDEFFGVLSCLENNYSQGLLIG